MRESEGWGRVRTMAGLLVPSCSRGPACRRSEIEREGLEKQRRWGERGDGSHALPLAMACYWLPCPSLVGLFEEGQTRGRPEPNWGRAGKGEKGKEGDEEGLVVCICRIVASLRLATLLLSLASLSCG